MTAPRAGSNYFNAELQQTLQSKGRSKPAPKQQTIKIIMLSKSHPSYFPMVFTNLFLHALFLFFQTLIFPREHYWYKFHTRVQFIFGSYFLFPASYSYLQEQELQVSLLSFSFWDLANKWFYFQKCWAPNGTSWSQQNKWDALQFWKPHHLFTDILKI